ncbi:hypothetical protein BDK51DRAFT_24179, partial [Blyttiomyces helicus]
MPPADPLRSTASINATSDRSPSRSVYINDPPDAYHFNSLGEPLQTFPPNGITTSKYNLMTFVPKNLWEQFRRVANLFFLSLIIVQFFPAYRTINPFVAALPLFVIVCLTAAKDGFEDWRRHKSDQQINGQKTWTVGLEWRNVNEPFFVSDRSLMQLVRDRIAGWCGFYRSSCRGKVFPSAESEFAKPAAGGAEAKPEIVSADGLGPWRATAWQDVRVGDFVLLRGNDPIPSDVIILSTSEPDALCYVETKNLDGETNLKIRRALEETRWMRGAQDCVELRCILETEKPNTSLYTFVGKLSLPSSCLIGDPHHGAGRSFNGGDAKPAELSLDAKVPLNMDNMLMRGCILRNTEWAIGIAVYTGPDTKIRMNAGATPSKRSVIERTMNPQVFGNLGLLVIMCVVMTLMAPEWQVDEEASSPPWLDQTFLSTDDSWAQVAFNAFWLGLIAFQNVVPISLYLTVEIVKTLQAYFIFQDIKMYYEPLDQPCIPRSWNLADDLGQIEYIFSDKTGTLTRNVMEFKKLSVNGVVYGQGIGTAISPGHEASDGSKSKSMTGSTLLRNALAPIDRRSHLPGVASSIPTIPLAEESGATSQHAALTEFFLSLAVCHSVLVSRDADGELRYKAQSPDEAALVQAAKDAGFAFVARDGRDIVVAVRGVYHKMKLLNVLEFNSTRKRMSVVVRRPGGEIVLYCKGADSVIYERLREGQDALKSVTTAHLEYFAEEGLRTLCIGSTILSEEVYDTWFKTYTEASLALENREELLDAAAESIEKSLTLIGATAIEDRLQDGVPECIGLLMDAGIKVWVLTGDKMETAINIGFSCNLLARDMRLIIVRGAGAGEDEGPAIRRQLNEALERLFPGDGVPRMSTKARDTAAPRSSLVAMQFGLVIDGAALRYALEPDVRTVLLEVSTRCAAVICCRVSPLQKAQVVELVKNRPGKKTVCLAIGDGANDVSMIQAAHVGVGIAGEEGMQAVMASDYAIAQFRFLGRLLLVHGRWSYKRTSEMILCFFFKNILFVLPLFWYQPFAGYSGTMVIEFTYSLLYNVVFTSLPVGILGVYDQDVRDHSAFKVPPLYKSGIFNSYFSLRLFALYVLEAAYQSLIVLFFPLFAYNEQAQWSNGRCSDLDTLRVAIATVCVLNANMFVAVNTTTWTWFNFAVYGASTACVLFYTLIYSAYPGSALMGVTNEIFTSPTFWLLLPLATVACHLPRMVVRYAGRIIAPTDVEIVQE